MECVNRKKQTNYIHLNEILENNPKEGNPDMNKPSLNVTEDLELENKNIYVQKGGGYKTSASYQNFEIRHCKRIKSILYNDEKYNSLYHPSDDIRSFFIKRLPYGGFKISSDKSAIVGINRKRQLLKEQFEIFIAKINTVIDTENLYQQLRFIKLITAMIVIFHLIVIMVLAYQVVRVLFMLSTILLGGHDGNFTKNGSHGYDHLTASDFAMPIVYSLICACLFLALRKWSFYNSSKRNFICFIYFLNKKPQIDDEIESWNNEIFLQQNMKAQLAETFDYIQILYDRNSVYQYDSHYELMR